MLGNSRPNHTVALALKPIEAVSTDLAARCVDYVQCGSGAEILLSLQQTTDKALQALLLNPGSLSIYSWVPAETTTKLKTVGLTPEGAKEGRRKFYTYKPSVEQLVRMGRLLAAISGQVDRANKIVPDWLTVLVNDVAMSRKDINPHTGDHLAKAYPQWTPDLLEDLLRYDNPAAPAITTTVITALFTIDHESSYRLPTTTLAGLDAYLSRVGGGLNPRDLSQLSAWGKVGFIERVADDPAALAACSATVAGLSVDNAKGVRRAALTALRKLDVAEQRAALAPVLISATPSRAGDLVDYLGATDWGLHMLNEAADAGAKITTVVGKLNDRQDALGDTEEVELVLPAYQPLPDGDSTAAAAQMRAWLTTESRIDADLSNQYVRKAAKRARSVTDADIADLMAKADGTDSKRKSRLLGVYSLWALATAMPALGVAQLLRLGQVQTDNLAWVARMRITEDTDLRALSDVCASIGLDDAWVASVANLVSVEAAWPWFATRQHLIAELLTESVATTTLGLQLLAGFPHLPTGFLPRVATIAMGESKVNRPLAQDLLATHPAARSLAEQGLADGKTEVRAAAAGWLARLGDPAGLPALVAALAKERRETVRAAFLTALEELGGDVATYLGPKALLEEAIQGLKAKPPASMGWFLDLTLPVIHWADGSIVDPQIPRWWAVLATKMKNPDGSGLLDRYLSLLDPADAATFSTFVLRAWIAHDTRHPDPAESRARAETTAPQRYQHAQEWLARTRAEENPRWLEYAVQAAAVPLEQHIAEIYRSHQSQYLGSAASEKGLLGLTTRAPGIDLANAVAAYIRSDGSRRAQVEYLVHTLYANGQSAAVQLLLSIARRHKQASVQAKAMELVDRLAEDRGWTADQLADRTIPTAGFSEDRLLHLDFGPREFLGRITAKATIDLTDADGKPLKALPSPRQDDDQELAAAAKKQLATSRKELKAVLALQTGRLYEAMCAQRSWPVADWQEFLAEHPLVSGLIPRLVWVEESESGPRSFRPTEDGSLIDVDDQTVELTPGSQITLAHSTVLPTDEVVAWQQHLLDYEVVSLFDQFSSSVPEIKPHAPVFAELAGHLTDTFSFRNVATKRGYTRGAAEDGGWFSEYTKAFTGLKLTAVIEFTGSYLPEDNIACATEKLYFRQGRRQVPLSQVPPILMAECYADYAALAALGPYDADYRKKAGI